MVCTNILQPVGQVIVSIFYTDGDRNQSSERLKPRLMARVPIGSSTVCEPSILSSLLRPTESETLKWGPAMVFNKPSS